ncbi:MAG: hypothetical protein IJ107_00825 [Lachnospiraceae bacterium]|nr:hypothetical protein [Lachnospiraceae bacterium]
MSLRSTTSRKWLSMALIIAFAISIAILGVASLPAVYAQDDAPKAERTIMYYEDGCDPEATAGAASANLVEAMNAEFDNEQMTASFFTYCTNPIVCHLCITPCSNL